MQRIAPFEAESTGITLASCPHQAHGLCVAKSDTILSVRSRPPPHGASGAALPFAAPPKGKSGPWGDRVSSFLSLSLPSTYSGHLPVSVQNCTGVNKVTTSQTRDRYSRGRPGRGCVNLAVLARVRIRNSRKAPVGTAA